MKVTEFESFFVSTTSSTVFRVFANENKDKSML